MESFSRKRKQNSFGGNSDDSSSSSSSSDDFGNDDNEDDDLRLEGKASRTTTIATASAMTTSPMTGMGGAATVSNGHGNVLVRRATIGTSLSKKLLEVFRPNHLMNAANEPPDMKKKPPTLKVSDETADSLSEVIRMFVVEAHNRAMIEAECDAEGEELDSDVDNDDDDNDNDEMMASAACKNDSDGDNITTKTKKKNNDNIKPVVPIHAKHITKIAAELLMDFS